MLLEDLTWVERSKRFQNIQKQRAPHEVVRVEMRESEEKSRRGRVQVVGDDSDWRLPADTGGSLQMTRAEPRIYRWT